MPASAADLVLGAPLQYIGDAHCLLQAAENSFTTARMTYPSISVPYCDAQTKLEQAQAINRAVLGITNGKKVPFSDMVTLQRWIDSESHLKQHFRSREDRRAQSTLSDNPVLAAITQD